MSRILIVLALLSFGQAHLAHAADADLIPRPLGQVADLHAESPRSLLMAISQIGELSEPNYDQRVAQYRRIADRPFFTVYVQVARENLSSILRNGFFKRVGASGIFAAPPPISADSRMISPPLVLALMLDRDMVQLPDDNGLGLALSTQSAAKLLPNLRIYKSADISNGADSYSTLFIQGKLGWVSPQLINIVESLRATAFEYRRHDQAQHEHVLAKTEVERVGDLDWPNCVLISKAIFMDAVSRLKLAPVKCSGLLSFQVKEGGLDEAF